MVTSILPDGTESSDPNRIALAFRAHWGTIMGAAESAYPDSRNPTELQDTSANTIDAHTIDPSSNRGQNARTTINYRTPCTPVCDLHSFENGTVDAPTNPVRNESTSVFAHHTSYREGGVRGRAAETINYLSSCARRRLLNNINRTLDTPDVGYTRSSSTLLSTNCRRIQSSNQVFETSQST